jgi:2-oxoglutarate ferredoxin oxidoreductase subunit alpha
VIEQVKDASIGIVAFGSTEPAIQEARHQLDEMGVTTSFMRVRAVPFTEDVEAFIREHEQVFVVEMNRDGQLHQLLTVEYPQLAPRMAALAYTDGLPLTAQKVRSMILDQTGAAAREEQ